MLLRFFALFLFILLSGCVRTNHSPVYPTEMRGSLQNRLMSSFNRVDVEGPINIRLRTGYKEARVLLRGDPRDLAQIHTKIVDHTLLIRIGHGYPRYGEISAEIRAPYLNAFGFDGMGTILGNHVHSGLLDLSINNPGQTKLSGSMVIRRLKVNGGGNVEISGVRTQFLQLKILGKTKLQLAGMVNISNLNIDGDGLLSMYWVKSPFLKICARGRTFIQLGGVVDKLDVELFGTAHFNGRYLRAKNAFVKTHQKSIADITVVKHQHTLALDASDIYFYKIPETKADFMAFDGSVLDMRDWNRWDLRDWDRYNSRSSKERSNLSKRPILNMG